MKVYHGGYMAVKVPKILKSKFSKDFGEGFYCTGLEQQAVFGKPVKKEYKFLKEKLYWSYANLNMAHKAIYVEIIENKNEAQSKITYSAD